MANFEIASDDEKKRYVNIYRLITEAIVAANENDGFIIISALITYLCVFSSKYGIDRGTIVEWVDWCEVQSDTVNGHLDKEAAEYGN